MTVKVGQIYRDNDPRTPKHAGGMNRYLLVTKTGVDNCNAYAMCSSIYLRDGVVLDEFLNSGVRPLGIKSREIRVSMERLAQIPDRVLPYTLVSK